MFIIQRSLLIELRRHALCDVALEAEEFAVSIARIFRDVLDRSVLNRIDRWVMVSVHASRADDRGLAWLLSQIKFGDEGDVR